MKNKFLILLLFIPLSLYSQNIKVATLYDIPPISFINENGESDGFFTDVIKEIAILEGWNIEWKVGSWGDSYNAVLDNKIDLMVGILRSEERDKYLTFNEEYVMTSWSSIYTPSDSKIENVLDLEGKRIGLMYNDQNAKNFRELANSFNISYIDLTVQNYSDILELLEANEIDAGVFFNLYAARKENIKKSPIIFSPSNSYFAINKESDNQYILDAIDFHLKEWKADNNSYYYQLYNKWFDFESETEVTPKWVNYSLYASVILITIALLFIYALNKTVISKTKELKELNENLEIKVRESSEKLIDTEKIALSAKLVAGIAHEINTPLGIGITSISHLKTQLKEAEDKFKNNSLTKEDLIQNFEASIQFYDIILSNLERAAALINNFKQISSDNITQTKRITSLKDYIEKIIVSLTPEIKKSNFIIGMDLEDIIIETYPDVFAQILINFIMNSKTHAFDDNSILPHIKINLRAVNNHIELIYEDNGKGIENNKLKSIFDPFYSTNKIKGNVGLGLAIVNNIVKDKLKGSIRVESEINKYTRFIIKFPTKEE